MEGREMKGWLTLFTAAAFFVAWCWMIPTPSQAESSPRYRIPEKCLSWDGHKVKYPGIKGEYLLGVVSALWPVIILVPLSPPTKIGVIQTALMNKLGYEKRM